MKTTRLLLISILLLIYGCGDSEPVKEATKNIEDIQEKLNPIVPLEHEIPKTANDLLKKMGFDFNGEKVTIDMNKTTNFFERMEIEMHGRADELERKIGQADINFTKGMGIDITNDRIGIDLNQTRNMLQQLNSLVKDIVLDINNTRN
jgi:hypothetical protein